MAFDTAKSELVKNNFAVGYAGTDFTLHTAMYAMLFFRYLLSSVIVICTNLSAVGRGMGCVIF
jgi:hypothetical protein